jgi:hypothetical protein
MFQELTDEVHYLIDAQCFVMNHQQVAGKRVGLCGTHGRMALDGGCEMGARFRRAIHAGHLKADSTAHRRMYRRHPSFAGTGSSSSSV